MSYYQNYILKRHGYKKEIYPSLGMSDAEVKENAYLETYSLLSYLERVTFDRADNTTNKALKRIYYRIKSN
ncbi:MAG: hypothetical protein OHK0057_01520 [Thermoflexibacter sp.]